MDGGPRGESKAEPQEHKQALGSALAVHEAKEPVLPENEKNANSEKLPLDDEYNVHSAFLLCVDDEHQVFTDDMFGGQEEVMNAFNQSSFATDHRDKRRSIGDVIHYRRNHRREPEHKNGG